MAIKSRRRLIMLILIATIIFLYYGDVICDSVRFCLKKKLFAATGITFTLPTVGRTQMYHSQSLVTTKTTTKLSTLSALSLTLTAHQTTTSLPTVYSVRGDSFINTFGLMYYGLRPSAKPCRLKSFVVMMINSKPNHQHRRAAIRATWGNVSNIFRHSCKHPYVLRVLFVVGKSNNETLDRSVDGESMLHNDMVLGDFTDNLKNLTEKTLMSMAWSLKFCFPTYIYKGDDDVFVNIFYLMHHLAYQATHGRIDRYWIGRVDPSSLARRVVRRNDSKYYVPFEDYKEKLFPKFASGFSYVMSSDIVRGMLKFGPPTKKLQTVDDVYVAILGKKWGIQPRNDQRFHLYIEERRRRVSPYLVKVRFTEHGITQLKQQVSMFQMAKSTAASYRSVYCPPYQLLDYT